MGIKTLVKLLEGPLDLLCPDRCVACGEPAQRPADLPLVEPLGLCNGCAASIVPLARPFCLDCRHGEQRWSCSRNRHLQLLAGLQYGDTVRNLIHATKYQRLPGLVNVWLRAWVSLMSSPRGPLHIPARGRPELLAPIPLHPSRVRERGADVVELWTRALARLHGIPTARVLRRRRPTPPQVGLGREQRARNLAGSFAPGPDIAMVEGRRVVLVDDVVTTGATGREAAAVLVWAGAGHVSLWSFAYEPLE